MAKSKQSDERQARLEAMQAKQRAADRRRGGIIVAVAVAVALVLIAVVAFVIVDAQGERSRLAELAAEDIEGVEEFEDLPQDHVTTPVDYAQTPPVGGNHLGAPDWTSCGFYPEPVVDESAVHSLEHGAVWVTHDPDLPAEQVSVLEELATDNPYLLVSPYEGLPSPVVASAWGLQLQLDSVEDERLQAFLLKYLQGPQTPEPGATCSNGTNGVSLQ